jgi:hypothetical protein
LRIAALACESTPVYSGIVPKACFSTRADDYGRATRMPKGMSKNDNDYLVFVGQLGIFFAKLPKQNQILCAHAT